MDDFLHDVRHAVRILSRAPGFTIAAVAALALGIGANTAVFSVVNAVLLKPLPYPAPNRLIVFLNTSPQGSGPGASPTKFNVWRQQTSAFQDVSAYRFTFVNVTSDRDPVQIPAGFVSADFFRLFGAPIAAGRAFTPDEDRPGGGRVVVLSDGFWKRRFGGDPDVIGRTLTLDGDPHVIVGILGSFDTDAIQSAADRPDVWLPFQIDPDSAMQGHFFMAAGRYKPGVTPAAASTQLQVAAAEFRGKFPDALGPQGGFGAQPLEEIVVRNVRSSLLVLLGAVSFVLLIACANVANLMMVRANVRKREIAIRAALGAGPGRIVRQLLAESLVLSSIGGALGLLGGVVGIRALLAVSPGNIPRTGVDGSSVGVDWRVLAFTALVAVATGLIFGVVPAFRAARTDLSTTLKESGASSAGGFRQNKLRSLLIVTEIGLALVLLVGAGLFMRTFVALRTVDPGFDAQQVLTMRMSLSGARFAKTASVAQVIRDGAERLKALPVVEVASAACCVPLQGGFGLPFVIEGRPLEGPFHGGGGFTPISADYFSVFRIPVVRGRAFTEDDDGGAPNVAIINQAMARRYWPNGDPLSDRITIAKGLPELADPTRQIVGVAGDVRSFGLDQDPQPTVYIPWSQLPDVHNANLLGITPLAWLVRTRGEPRQFSTIIENELRLASGGLPVARFRSMEEVVTQSTARSDFNMVLLAIFAGSALLLAVVGIYGVMAYTVQQRTQEVGIRMALGAEPRAVRNMVVAQGMRIALAGMALGVASAFALTRVVASFLFGVTAHDPLVFMLVVVLLSVVALIAVWLPARRAATINPTVALRVE